jgi:hypothetical protein
MNSALLLKQVLEEVKKAKWFKDNPLFSIMNNLRGINAGLGYCNVTELDILLCFSCLVFYCCYIIYIIDKKVFKDKWISNI